MKIGLVGFPGSGKSTVFGALTGMAVDTGYAARSEKAHLGTVKVPDPRVAALSRLYQPKKTTYAEITFRDVGGGHEGELDRKVLVAMREVDALCQVVRAFPDASGEVPDALREIRDLETETILADLEIAEPRAARLRKDRSDARELELVERIQAHLEEGGSLRSMELGAEELRMISGYSFLSLKPLLLVLNCREDDISEPVPEIDAAASERGLGLVILSAPIEMDIAQMAEDEQKEFLESLGLQESARDRFIRAAFELIDPRLARAPGHAGASGGGQDPLGHRARLHPRRGDPLRGPHRARQRGEVPRAGEAPRRRQGVRHPGRRRRELPLQRLAGCFCPQPEPAPGGPRRRVSEGGILVTIDGSLGGAT
jgi:ribosome-binding ATPase YchF (GTP1/OBG family)